MGRSSVKVTTNVGKDIEWRYCGNCGHAIMGITTMKATVKVWPEPVKPPKKKSKRRV